MSDIQNKLNWFAMKLETGKLQPSVARTELALRNIPLDTVVGNVKLSDRLAAADQRAIEYANAMTQYMSNQHPAARASFKVLADLNYKPAKQMYAHMLAQGQGGPVDLVEAEKYQKKHGHHGGHGHGHGHRGGRGGHGHGCKH